MTPRRGQVDRGTSGEVGQVGSWRMFWLALGGGGTLVALLAVLVIPGVDLHRSAYLINGTVALLSAFGAVSTWLRARREPAARLSWRLFAGVGGMGVVVSVAAIVNVMHGPEGRAVPAFPSAADVLLIPVLLLIAVAHLMWPRTASSGGERARTALDGALFATACLALSWALALGEMARASELTAGFKVAAIAAWAATTVDLGVVVYVCAPRSWLYAGPVGLLALGLSVGAVNNLVMAALAFHGRYFMGHPIDVLGAAAFMLSAAAPWMPRPVTPERHALAPGRLAVVFESLPYWPVVLALPICVASLMLVDPPDRVLLGLMAVLVLILLFRQFLALRDVRILSQTLEVKVAQRTAELEQSHAALVKSQRLESVATLAGGIAHDFNNLLTVVSGSVAMLRKARADLRDNRDLEFVDEAAARGAALTRQLLTFARRDRVEPMVLRPAILVEELQRLIRRALGEGVELDLDLDPHAGAVRIDQGQFEQVVMNLVVNARDALAGAGRLTIRVARHDALPAGDRQPVGPCVRIVVADTGVGMERAVLARVFDPFFTTKGPEGGTGLGLASVYGIVKGAGGHIGVESELGVGTSFQILLPAVTDAVTPPPEPVAPLAPRVRAGTVLIAEDNDAVRALIRRSLLDQGFRVLDAGDGQEAVEIATAFAEPIDLLICDAIMPRLGGRDTVARVRQDRPGIRVLCISGYSDDWADPGGLVNMGMRFLAKPFSPDQLLRVIDEMSAAGSAS